MTRRVKDPVVANEPGITGSNGLANGLAAKLDATTLSEPAENLRRCRAARTERRRGARSAIGKRSASRVRAAEQEAAAVAAEAEAANMTDHRGIEKTSMLKEFKAHGLTEQEIAPDGHCLFSAIADQLKTQNIVLDTTPSDQPKVLPYKVVRRVAAGYIESHPDDYAAFLEEPLEDYVAKIRDTAEWGGQLELIALANAYKVEIRVVQDGGTEVIRPNTAGKADQVRTIWLAYYRHGYGLGEHYNSLRKAP